MMNSKINENLICIDNAGKLFKYGRKEKVDSKFTIRKR